MVLQGLPRPAPGVAEEAVNASDIVVPALPLSMLSQAEQTEAISFFEAQRRNWLGVRTVTTHFTGSLCKLVDGEVVADPNRCLAGTLEFAVSPLAKADRFQSPVRVQVRMSCDKCGMHFLGDNALGPSNPSQIWADEVSSANSRAIAELKDWAFQTELFFFPLDLMAKTVTGAPWDNVYAEPAEKFFAERGLPRRRSTPEETQTTFGGEPQYLFMVSPAIVDACYWFSAVSGELRQIDVFLPGGAVKTFRYENYVQQSGSDIRFPQRFVLTYKSTAGGHVVGWQYAVEITELELNKEIPADRFAR
jgi:hypothetical protein